MNKLLALPWWADLLLIGFLVGGVGLVVHSYNRWQQGIGEARVQARWDREKVGQQGVAIKAQSNNQAESDRRISQQSKVIDEQAQKLAQALADNDGLRAGRERVRAAQSAYLAATRGGGPACHSATAGASSPAGPAGDLLADVQRRLDEATDGVGRFADQSHIAGLTCEGSYDALTR